MTNYFLGFFPDEKGNHQIKKVVGEVGKVFAGQGINVRWVKPETFHVTLLFLGSNLNIFQRIILNRNIKNLIIPKFKFNFRKAELGISKQYKELVYLSVNEGGENLRNLVFSLRKIVKSEDFPNKIHHLTLGRATKDLSAEEIRNIQSDLKNINESLQLENIWIESNNLWLVKSDDNGYQFLKKFDVA